MDPNRPSLSEILQEFRFDGPWAVLVVGAALLFAWAMVRANRAGHRHPARKAIAFYAGLVLVAATVFSPLEHYGNQMLWVNFLGFLVLTMMAAPLIVASSPLTLAFRATGKRGRSRLRHFYRRFPISWLTFPIVSWLGFAITTYAWQFSRLAEFAARDWWVRDLQLLTLLLVSLLFWMPALAADPLRWRMVHPLRALYVFVEMTHKGLFGGMFLSMSTPFHQHFSANPPPWAPDPLLDQRMAILILWIGGNAFFMVALTSIVIGWTRYESRNQYRTDLRLARQRESERRRRAALDQVFTR